MKKILFTIPIIFFGCSNNLVWNKPGASQDEFAKNKYICLQQSQQYSSGSYIAPNALLGGYQGFSSGGMGTNPTLFESCMNSKGWYLTQQNNSSNFYSSSNQSSNGPNWTGDTSKGWRDGDEFKPNANWSVENLCYAVKTNPSLKRDAQNELNRRNERCQ